MKYNFFFLCLLSFCLCHGAERSDLGPNKPDDTAKIERPCVPFDLNCVREFIFNHAQCKKTYGPIPDPFRRSLHNQNFPRVNLTGALVDLMVTGLNGRIDEFYINRDTDNLVIAIDFRDVRFTSDNSNYQIHQRAQEPVLVVDAFAINTFQSVLVTGIIPKIDDLQLDKTEAVAYISGLLTAVPGRNIIDAKDPRVQVELAEFLADLPTSYQELLLTDALFFLTTFIQYNLCDFGLQVF